MGIVAPVGDRPKAFPQCLAEGACRVSAANADKYCSLAREPMTAIG
jgi:hypothetical protein